MIHILAIFVEYSKKITKNYKLTEESSSTEIMQLLQTKYNIPHKYFPFK